MCASVRATICAFIVLFAGLANAATISVDDSSPEFALVTIEGELVLTDHEQFRQKVSAIPRAIVVLQSDGGNLRAGIEIGKIIRIRNYSTFVPSHIRCASACALAWLGGTRRYMGSNALVGFHAARNAVTGRESVANALVGSYLAQIGLPEIAIIYITDAAPTSMRYLNLADAKEVGIEVSLFDLDRTPPSASPSTSPPAPKVSQQLRERSQQFIGFLYASTSGATDNVASSLSNYYADKVVYYGKELPRAQVLSQIQKFLSRWPTRKYQPKDGSIVINCDEATLMCAVTGILVFDAQSPERNERSSGEATFEYRLSFVPLHSGPKIISESGSVIKRELTALNTTQPFEPLLNLFGLKLKPKRYSQP